MIDNHIHIGQYEEIYYDPIEILNIVKDNGIIEAAYSSITSGKKNVKYHEVYSEINSAISLFSDEYYKPYLWFVPSYIDEGITVEKAMTDLPYKGFKIHPYINNWDLSVKIYLFCLHELFEFAQDKKLPILIHTGSNNVDAPNRFELFFNKYPKTNIILAHCRPIEETITILNKYPNIYGDTSFVCEEWIKLLIENRLGNRIIPGSDFPITHYWNTHFNNSNEKKITLIEQYQLDITTMKHFEVLLKNQNTL